MKPHALVPLALFALCLFAAPSISAESSADPVNEQIPPERLRAKVLKVFVATDGDAIFRAYVVKWKNQEIVVSDPLGKSNNKEGDTITFLAMNHAFPQGKEPYRLLAFTLVAERR